MTFISSLILDAYRESNIIPLASVPTDGQNTEALRLYNAVLSATYGTDEGETLRDWPLGNLNRDTSNFPWEEIPINDRWLYQPPINSRLLALNEGPISVDLTAIPQDGARYAILDPFGQLATNPITINGNGRPISGSATFVANQNGLSQTWIYRADLGSWVPLAPVELTDQNPFPADFDQMFIVLLALRLNPRYGRDLTDLSQSILKVGRAAFVARYINSQPLITDDSISWPFMSRMGYGYGRAFSSTNGFNQGRIYG